MGKRFGFIIIVFLAIVGVAVLFKTAKQKTLLSPVGSIISSKNNKVKNVVGFLPYWNLKKANELDFSALDTVYYFAVDLNGDGSFNTKDPGWGNLKSDEVKDVKKKVKRWGLTIINLDQSSIAQNVNNANRRQRIINNVVKLMKDEGFVDLNIDLEYIGEPDKGLTQGFSKFVADITDSVHREIPGSTVSMDAFADSVVKPRIFDMKSLGQSLDQIIIMAYDIHRLSSINAGPISPLFGKEKYEYDVTTSVADYLSKVPSNKIMLGVPFYGYEWPTLDNEKGSFVIKNPREPEISSYRRSMQTAKDNNVSINFDDESGSVWFSYYDKDYYSWRQVWFENERSLGLKFDLVNQKNLGGVAIFALGYDGKEAKPLWDEVRSKFGK